MGVDEVDAARVATAVGPLLGPWLVTGFVGGLTVGELLGVGLTLKQPLETSARARPSTTARPHPVTVIRDMAKLWTRSIDVCFFTVWPLVASRGRPTVFDSGTAKHRFPFPLPPSERGAPIGQAPLVSFCSGVGCDNQPMEIVTFGETCLRLRGREGIVATDAFPRIVGPTGRGLSADIVTFSHTDGQQTLGLDPAAPSSAAARRKASARADSQRVPTSLESGFVLDSPGEFEVHHVLITGVHTYRDEHNGAERGSNVCFVFELDGVHVAHLGDIGHLLTQAQLGEIGQIDVVCVPIGGSLAAARAAELVAQLDANLIVPMAIEGAGGGTGELERFLHEMSVTKGDPVPKLAVTSSSLPTETTVVLLDPRNRT